MFFDLADSASMTCYHCGGGVCVICQRMSIKDSPGMCDSCGTEQMGPAD